MDIQGVNLATDESTSTIVPHHDPMRRAHGLGDDRDHWILPYSFDLLQ